MGKSILSGLPAETRKQIREQIKVGKKLAKQQEEQEYEKYWTSLNALKQQIDGLVEKAKASGKVPKGTTLQRLTMMPKAKPTRWSSVFKRIFGRKTKKVATKNKKATATPKAPPKAAKKKAVVKAKKTRHKSAGAMATRANSVSEKKYEDKRKNDDAMKERKNAARRLRRANGSTN